MLKVSHAAVIYGVGRGREIEEARRAKLSI